MSSFNLMGETVKVSSYGFNIQDNESCIYEAIKNNDTIIIDKQIDPWIVSPLTFRNLENKTIVFEVGVVLKAKSGAYLETSDSLLKFINCKNIYIYGNGALMLMRKNEYLEGEWRMGISLLGCYGVLIKDLTVSSSGGDGIYLDGYKEIPYSENIVIDHIVSINNKRQGMSIISAKDVWIKNSIFTQTNGTLPEAGLDIEPDSENDFVMNVNFDNCKFTKNHHAGITIGLDNLTDKSQPVSIKFKDCYLAMNHDASNPYPAAEIVISSHPNFPVKGNVSFEDIKIGESNWSLLYSRKLSRGFHVSFKNVFANKICKKNIGSAAIYLEVPDYFKSSGPIGGFAFENIFVKFKSESPFFTIKGSSLGTLRGVKNIFGEITIKNPNLTKFIDYIKYNSNRNNNFDVNFTLRNSN